MSAPVANGENLEKIAFGAEAAFAVMAGIQLDIFTALHNNPMTGEQLANSIGVNADRLRLLLYCLVAAGLLTKDSILLSNSAEADHFLVKGSSSYTGDMYLARAMRWP